MRVSLLSYKMPEVSGTQTGVFSKIPRHEPTHDKRYLETAYFDSYDKKFTNASLMDTRSFHQNHVFAGNETGFKKPEKIKITTQLISEKYNTGKDPKYNSSIQRTWIGHKDAAIKAVDELKIDNTKELILPPIDNELSIKLGNGRNFDMMRSKTVEGCPKRGTDITKTTVKVFNLRR